MLANAFISETQIQVFQIKNTLWLKYAEMKLSNSTSTTNQWLSFLKVLEFFETNLFCVRFSILAFIYPEPSLIF